jgi:hypothetical protein
VVVRWRQSQGSGGVAFFEIVCVVWWRQGVVVIIRCEQLVTWREDEALGAHDLPVQLVAPDAE